MWQGNEYVYSARTLKVTARFYDKIYQGLPLSFTFEVTDPLQIAEYRADFDRALDAIGRGCWDGQIDDKDFWDFKFFGKLQRIVIADIYGIADEELEGRGFYRIPQMRGRAYRRMVECLNGERTE